MNTLPAALVNGFVVSVPIVAAVWLALRVSRRSMNAATRYAIWWILLALVICLPFRYVPSRHSSPHYAPVAATQAALAAPEIAPGPPVVSRPLPAATPRFPLRLAAGSWSVWVMAAWAIAVFVMLLRLFVSYAMLWKMKREAHDAPEVVVAAAQSALDRLGVARRVRVAVVNDAVSPMVAGPLRPTILLPTAMLESMDDQEIGQILLHEAAHLARRDDWALMAQRVIEAVFAPHPLVRWIASWINLEREIACDDMVISMTGSARHYAACLTRIAEMAGAFSGSSAAAAVSDERSHLTRRVEMLLDKSRHAGARLLGARLAVLVCGLALVTFITARMPGMVAFAAAPHIVAAWPAALIAQARPSAPASVPGPAKRSAAQTVHIAVSVTDPMNRFVTGLEAGAFHIFENGVEQKIVDFTPQKRPVSIGIVWDEQSELRNLRSNLAQLRVIYKPGYPGVRAVEARIAEIENRTRLSVDVPGSEAFVTQLDGNQSLAEGLESAIDQLRSKPVEQAAVVLVFDVSSWNDVRANARINALIGAAGVPVYVLGLVSEWGTSSSADALPILISSVSGFVQYPVTMADQAPRILAGLANRLVNQYIIGYVPSGSPQPGRYRPVEVRMTAPAGLPQLTARVSSGFHDPR